MMTYNRTTLNKVLLFAAAFITWQGCLKTDLTGIDGIELSPAVAVPLVKATFAFQDFMKSDSLLKIDNTGSVQILYSQDSIASYSVADIVSQATGTVGANVSKNVAMGDLSIAGFNLTKTTTLSSFSSSFSEPAKSLFANGGTTPFTGIPAFMQATNTVSNLDDIAEFQSITLASGQLQLSIKNDFPFALTNLNIELLDRGNGNTLITTINVGNLAIGATTNATADLANKTFSNKLAYRVPSLNCAGIAANTAISSTSTLSVIVASSNMKIKNGTVKMTAQTLPAENIIAAVTTGNAAQKLQEITIKSAVANYTITKNIATNFKIDLVFPTVKENGVAVKKTIDVTSNSVTGSIAFNNAVMDLTSIAAQPFNQLPIQATVSVLASTGYVAINATDAISINTTLGSIVVGGAKGQFGSFNIAIPKKSLNFAYDFSYLNKSSQKLIFDNPVMKLRYTNSFGIPISANLNIAASGLLGSNEGLGAPTINISYPKIAQAGQTIKDSFSITKTNSKIVQFLSILPNKIDYDGNVSINSSNSAEVNYFLPNSKINMGFDFVLPLKFSTQNLILRDTIKAGFVDPTKSTDSYESAALLIEHNNGFPLKTAIDLIALTGTTTTSIVENFSIPSASVAADGRVSQANTGKQTLALNKTQLSTLLKAEKVIIVARLQTAGDGTTPVVMLPTYIFDVGIGMQAKFKIKQ